MDQYQRIAFVIAVISGAGFLAYVAADDIFLSFAQKHWREDKTSFEKMSWFEYWKHAFLKVIRMSSKVLYQHCMLLRYVGIVFWMQKIQRNSSNGQFHCFHYVRKRAPCWKDLFLMETRETKTHFSQWFPPVWPKRGIPWESWRPGLSENVVVFKFWRF